jgi:hypothetical protein
MSANMGSMTNTGEWHGTRTDSEGVGMVVRTKCPACKKEHAGKPSKRCSRIKQQMYLRGEL